MGYESLREWLEKLEETGELKRIKAEVDWNEEIGGIVHKVYEMKDKAPALLFENIKDYQNTHCKKLFTSSLSTYTRIALMLDLPQNTPVKEIIQTVRERVKNPLKPVPVKDGPCKQYIEKGDEVNVLQFPVPKWHARDGGRYINTCGGVITKHPHTGWVNVGIYRGMVVDNNTISWMLQMGKHWGHHYCEYKKMGKPMPVAVVYGWDPVLPFVAGVPYPAGINEYEIMGALRGKPVELIPCETVDLEVPATAEIVLEGFIPLEPESYRAEGPFGEFTGYYASLSSPKPVSKIICITHRREPIFQGTVVGVPPNEDSRCSSINMSAVVWEALDRMGIPGITDVFCPPSIGNGTNVRVQINKRYKGHAKQVAACIWSTATHQFKNVLVVDDDVDIRDPDALEWAFAYRVDPKEDIVIFPGCPGTPLDPSSSLQDEESEAHGGGARWNRLLIDATKTWRWGPRKEWEGELFPPKVEVSLEIQRKVQNRWQEYGF